MYLTSFDLLNITRCVFRRNRAVRCALLLTRPSANLTSDMASHTANAI